MKKVFATLLVGMLAVFSFAAFEVTGGYANVTLDDSLIDDVQDVTLHGISGGVNYLFEGLGIEGGALLVGGSVDYYFPAEVDSVTITIDGTELPVPSYTLSQTGFSVNGGYRQSLNVFFPDLGFGMYVQGLLNYSFGTVTQDLSEAFAEGYEASSGLTFPESVNIEIESDSSSWGLGGGVGASFVVQNFDVNVGADILFEKITLTNEDLSEEDFEADQWKPKFKIHAGLQF